ncbi:uncharacterized protein LOC109599406 isoform X2 [Aethina tumida]|uniref:uncharacterized protein LOC109599406 isoform X2 n=1 Tax=Aethina tumida TaxID=116153 RepID=UPI0021476C47|nr:uncharacterized protein LOC109599406 isoform X2 [Aethina tumida]
MTILHSCCFWRSVRKGSYVCGYYTGIWYLVTSLQASIQLHEEIKYFVTNFNLKPRTSFINHENTTTTTIVFTALLLFTSVIGFFTCLILLYGIYKDRKILLIPWITVLSGFILTDLIFIAYIFWTHTRSNPITSIIITTDLFINALNIYALLCVISQYQELKAGRGRASDDLNNRIPNIQYSSQPTATSYLSTRRPIPQDYRPTPTQSPSGTAPSLAIEEPSPVPNHRGPRKSVKFPDNSGTGQNGSQLLDPWTLDVKSPMLLSKAGDTAPLIETVSDGPVHTAV